MTRILRHRLLQRTALLAIVAPVLLFVPRLFAHAVVGHQNGSSSIPATQDIESTTLEPGKPVERDLDKSQIHRYRVALSQGQYVRVVVEQKAVDIVLKSFGPNETLIAESDSRTRPQGGEQAEVVAQSSATYAFQVEPKYKMLPGGHYQIRIDELRQAIEKDRQLQLARELYTQAFQLIVAGKYDEASEPARRALEVRTNDLGPDHPDIALTLTLLANIAYYKGDLRSAELLNQRAVAMLEKTLGPDHPQTATRLNNLGSVYQAKYEWDRAEQLHKRALAIRERVLPPNHPDIAQSLNNLANVYLDRGDYASAEPLYLRAIAINEKVLGPDHPNLAYPLVNLALAHMDENEYDQAEIFLKRALSIREARLGKDHPAVGFVLQNLGEVYISKRDYSKAEEIEQRALSIWESKLGPENANVGRALNSLGKCSFAQKDYAKAESLYLRALAIKEAGLGAYHPDTLVDQSSLARLYMVKGDRAQAVAFLTKALTGEDHNIDLNLAIGSERQREAYLATLPAQLDRAISLHVGFASDDSAARDLAITTILRRKGRVLDAMAQSLAAMRSRMSGQDQELLDHLSDTTVHLARLVLNGPQRVSAAEHQKQVATDEAEREKLEIEISRRTAGYYQQSQRVTLAAVQSALPDDAALIEMAVYRPFRPQEIDNEAAYGDPRYVAYVIRRQGAPQWKDLGPAQDIEKTIELWRKAVRDPQAPGVGRLGRALDQRLMQPLRPFLEGVTRLLVSPDGQLSLVPFEALVDEQNHFLIERYTFTYLTSGRDLLRVQGAPAKRSRPLIIADARFGEPAPDTAGSHGANFLSSVSSQTAATSDESSLGYFAPLTGTAREAESIHSLFPQARLLMGSRATKPALQQSQSPVILHIATHGFFLQDQDGSGGEVSSQKQHGLGLPQKTAGNPLLRSGLALAGANLKNPGADNGILTALEAANLNLWGTQLVTLSACDTGLGEVKNGEGVYGLRRAFVLAGAESLLMSLWPVSDYITREMMTSYYTGLKRGLGRADALHQAQLAMLRRKGREHPSYWASFIQSGEWSVLERQQ